MVKRSPVRVGIIRFDCGMFDTGEHKASLEEHTDRVTCVVFFPNGNTLVSISQDHTIRMWDGNTGTHKATLAGETDWVTLLVCAPDGKTLAGGGYGHTIAVWDAETGALKATFDGHTDHVFSVAYSPRRENTC